METPKKVTRRGHNEGTIRQRSDGTWEARISLDGGKRKSLYGKTRREVQDKLKAAQRDVDAGLDLGTSRQTVGQFLDRWIADVVTPAKAPKTTATYADIVRLHLKPGIGHHQLSKLSPQHLAALLKAKTDAGLSPSMVHHIRAVLRTALNQALRWGMVGRNVAALVESPRQTRREVTALTPTEAQARLAAAEGDRLAAAFRVALTLGLRQGEVLGLAWEDIDLDRRTLRVRRAIQRINGTLILKEPKTDKSRRTLTLPPSLIVALRQHADRQAFEQAAAGDRWQDRGFVFTTTIGTPIDPRNLIRSWHRIQKQHGLVRRNFHSTRHTAASLMLAEGVPIKVVQEVLGHSLLSTTADTYGHLFPEAFQQAADAMERALTG